MSSSSWRSCGSVLAVVPGVTLVDAHYRAELGEWTLTMTGRNLADRETYSHAFSCSSGSLYPEPGRWFGASVARIEAIPEASVV